MARSDAMRISPDEHEAAKLANDPSTSINATSETDTWQDDGGSVDTRQSR